MKRNPLVLPCALAALALAGCQEQPVAPPEVAIAQTRASAASLAGVPALDRSQAVLPAGAVLTDQHIAAASLAAINPGDYVCLPSTPVIDWFVGEVSEFVVAEPLIFDLLYNQLLADLIPQFEAMLFQTTATPQYFGYDGEHTKVLTKTERDVKRFWDIASADIQLIGMHGTVLLDTERVSATYQAVFGLPAFIADIFAAEVRDGVLASQVLDGGNHPLFSFNAFAFSATGIPSKIIMGDGVLAGYDALGFGDVAPQAIYAHEFAHHVQFRNGYLSDPLAVEGTPAEQGRYIELMADAYAGYYLTHKRGATMNRKRVEQFLEVFFQLGDCGFTSGGHHGTQNQRMAAARFGFDVADQAQKKGHILTSDAFHDLFVAAYPQLIAPDVP